MYTLETEFFQSHEHASFTSNLISNQSFYCLYFHIPSLICQNWTCFILQAVVLQLQSFNEIMQFLNKLLIFPQELITVCFNEIPNLENEHVKLTSNLFLSNFLLHNNAIIYIYSYTRIDKSVIHQEHSLIIGIIGKIMVKTDDFESLIMIILPNFLAFHWQKKSFYLKYLYQ